MIDRIINNLKTRRERVINGEVNCIPSSFTRFREDFVGIEQGKYFLVSGQTKAAKTQIATNMFVYNPLFYAYKNPDKIHLKIWPLGCISKSIYFLKIHILRANHKLLKFTSMYICWILISK